MTFPRVHKSVAAFCLVTAGSGMAAKANDVVLHATYLAAPTEWCPADAGVPIVGTMDGLDVIDGPATWPRQIRVRRGGASVDVNAVGEDIDATAPVIGRLSLEFRACQTPWGIPRATGVWSLTKDGSVSETGEFDSSMALSNRAFFRRIGRSSETYYANFGGRTFFLAREPQIKTSQTFAAETNKEQTP